MFTTALALGGLQLITIIVSWMLSPVRSMAWILCILWLLGVVVLVRHRCWIGGIARGWRRWACLLIWQLPGLLSGGCSFAIFTGWWHAPSIAVFVLQLWLQPLSPLLTMLPKCTFNDVACYLWVAASLPGVLFIASGLISSTGAAARAGTTSHASQP